jgi:glutathione S-transferase
MFAGAMSSHGPYFTGDTPTVVDFALAPFALRIELLLKHYKDFVLPKTGDPWARYATWWAAIKAHPAFLNTMPEPETYDARLIEFYLPYSKGGGQKDVTNLA